MAVHNGHGRGGGIDWGKVVEYLGGGRKYNQCRHRWHNVLKARAMREENSVTALGGDFNRDSLGWNSSSGSRATVLPQQMVPPPSLSSISGITSQGGQTAVEDAYANMQKFDI